MKIGPVAQEWICSFLNQALAQASAQDWQDNWIRHYTEGITTSQLWWDFTWVKFLGSTAEHQFSEWAETQEQSCRTSQFHTETQLY